MAKNIDEIIAGPSLDHRKKVKARAKELIAELTLQELRLARKLTQVRMNVAQKQISAIEKRTDLHISTLRRAIEAMGGTLHLIATFPNRKAVTLAGLADPVPDHPKARKFS